MITFATLGPAGSNHELATERYLRAHGLDMAGIRLVADFDTALALLAGGEVDHVVQVAVHPSAPATVARAYFNHGIHVVDTFIAATHPLAILTRAGVAEPRSLGLQPATRDYADLSRWPILVEEPTTVAVAEGLLAGRYDSGLTAAYHVERNPGRFKVEAMIGSVDDAWMVYGRARTAKDGLLVWRDSPAARLYKSKIANPR